MSSVSYCVCGKEKESELIECIASGAYEHCPAINAKYHIDCIDLTPDQRTNLIVYICKACKQRTNENCYYFVRTGTGSPRAGDRQQSDFQVISEASHEFEVERIMDHGLCAEGSGQMKFLIKWLGYPESECTWEFESSLYKIYDMVVDYRRRKELGSTSLMPFGGANINASIKFTEENWVALDKVEAVLKKYLEQERYCSGLPVTVTTLADFKKPQVDSIIVLLFRCHYYCILWLAKERRGLICDGANLSCDKEYIDELKKLTRLKLKSIRCAKNLKVDYCASAAVLSGMEFSRLYKHGNLDPDVLEFPNFFYNRIVKLFHPEDSAPTPGRVPIQEKIKVWKCRFCGKPTRKGRASLACHERQCPSKA